MTSTRFCAVENADPVPRCLSAGRTSLAPSRPRQSLAAEQTSIAPGTSGFAGNGRSNSTRACAILRRFRPNSIEGFLLCATQVSGEIVLPATKKGATVRTLIMPRIFQLAARLSPLHRHRLLCRDWHRRQPAEAVFRHAVDNAIELFPHRLGDRTGDTAAYGNLVH